MYIYDIQCCAKVFRFEIQSQSHVGLEPTTLGFQRSWVQIPLGPT